jgi:hypothetical protein
MTRARVVRVESARPHPNADRLDCLVVWNGYDFYDLVVGKHYVHGQMGIHIPPGAGLPGPLAVDLWLWGAKPDRVWTVEAKILRGMKSDGIFSGREYRVDPNDPRSVQKHAEMSAAGDVELPDGSLKWSRWNDAWALGDDVTDELGIVLA